MDEREMGSQPPVIILDHFSFTLTFVSWVGRGSFPTEAKESSHIFGVVWKFTGTGTFRKIYVLVLIFLLRVAFNCIIEPRMSPRTLTILTRL